MLQGNFPMGIVHFASAGITVFPNVPSGLVR